MEFIEIPFKFCTNKFFYLPLNKHQIKFTMKHFTLFISIIIALTMTSYAQEVTPSTSWSGEISLGGSKLKVEFVMKTLPDGQEACALNVPAQGAKNIPVEVKRNTPDSLYLSIPLIRAIYKGRKVSAESIVGIFTQNGMSLPLNLAPGKSELARPQMPKPPFAYTTEEIVFTNDAEGATLAGTLTYPIGYESHNHESIPVVLMVTGSGSQNRDEEILGHKPFFVIADFLARNGIASLRYDDRGVGQSTGSISGITTENNLADATAGVAYLRSLNKFGRIGVLGHSEGGTIAFMMGAEKSVDFLISLAGCAANGIDVIVGQNEAALQLQGISQEWIDNYTTALQILYKERVEGKVNTEPMQYVEELCKTNNLTLPDNLMNNLALCTTAGGEWFTWFLAYDPAIAIRQITCPVMAANGNLDLQVLSQDNLPIIRENLPPNKKSIIKEYDSLNHMFQHCSPTTALSYGTIEETISEELLHDIVNWIKHLDK